jgi:predicted MFS family arabinose efflux permease
MGGLGATGGLLLGAALTETVGWRSVFLVNAPIALGLFVAARRLIVTDHRDRARRRFDLPAAVATAGGLGLLMHAIVSAPEWGWLHPRTVGLLALAAAAVSSLRLIERRAPDPMLPRGVLNRTRLSGNALLLSAGMCVDGLLITLTGFTQDRLGYSPPEFAGLASALTAGAIAGGLVGQRLVSETGARRVALTGSLFLLASGAAIIQIADGDPRPVVMAGALLVFGAGIGAAAVSGQISALHRAPRGQEGVAAALSDNSFALGTALGVAAAASVAAAHPDNAHVWGLAATAVFAGLAFASAVALPARSGRKDAGPVGAGARR